LRGSIAYLVKYFTSAPTLNQGTRRTQRCDPVRLLLSVLGVLRGDALVTTSEARP